MNQLATDLLKIHLARRLHRVPCLALAAAWACLALLSVPADAAAPQAPPAGYASEDDVRAAIFSGKLKLVDRNFEVPESIQVTEGTEYGRGGDVALQLDLYARKDLAAPAPGLILIHGGAWRGGKRADYRYYGIKFAEAGYVVTSISYRLVQVAPFPAAVQDAKCAVRWMRANAQRLHVDPDRIAVMGGSAGGHLAMMIGYASDVPELEGDGGHAGTSSRVQAVVNLYGPTDLTTPTATGTDVVIDFFDGKTFDQAGDQYALASPIKHLTKDDPPTLTIHGTIDQTVPIRQADQLDRQLKELGLVSRYERLEGWPHTLDIAAEMNAYCRGLIEAFLAEHLSPSN